MPKPTIQDGKVTCLECYGAGFEECSHEPALFVQFVVWKREGDLSGFAFGPASRSECEKFVEENAAPNVSWVIRAVAKDGCTCGRKPHHPDCDLWDPQADDENPVEEIRDAMAEVRERRDAFRQSILRMNAILWHIPGGCW